MKVIFILFLLKALHKMYYDDKRNNFFCIYITVDLQNISGLCKIMISTHNENETLNEKWQLSNFKYRKK